MKRLVLSVSLLAAAGCGTLGDEAPYAAQVLNGGTGPFRLATPTETGIPSLPKGKMIDSTSPIGRAQLTDGAVFYEVAAVAAVPGTRDASLPSWEIDFRNEWSPRRIARSMQHVVDSASVTRLGYQVGTDVLVPTLAWEANGVGEPAIVQRPDGSVRLYYATDQGLGVAEAPSVDGTFTRLVTSPILGDVDGHGPASSPAPVLMPNGETWLYVAAGDAIYLATSSDGLAFTLVDLDPGTVAVDPLSLPPPSTNGGDAGVDAGTDAGVDVDAGVPITEVGFRAPTALVTRSHVGRTIVRLYFEVRRSDQTSVLAMAGSFDGRTFERAGALAYAKTNPTRPACFLRADGITLLTFATPRLPAGPPELVPMLGSTPGDLDLPPP